jgi:hypothetical protein
VWMRVMYMSPTWALQCRWSLLLFADRGERGRDL